MVEALLNRLAKPLHGFSKVLLHTPTLGVHEPQVVLRSDVTLFGSHPVQLNRLGKALLHTPTCSDLRLSAVGLE